MNRKLQAYLLQEKIPSFEFEKLCGELLKIESDRNWKQTHTHPGPDGSKDAYERKNGEYLAIGAFTTAKNPSDKVKDDIGDVLEADKLDVDTIEQFVFCCTEVLSGDREYEIVPDHWDLEIWDQNELLALLRQHEEIRAEYLGDYEPMTKSQSDDLPETTVKTAANVFNEHRDEINEDLRIYEDGIQVADTDLSLYDKILLYTIGAAVKENEDRISGWKSRVISGKTIHQQQDMRYKYPEIYLFVWNRNQFLQTEGILSKDEINAVNEFEWSIETRDISEALASIYSTTAGWNHKSSNFGWATRNLNELQNALAEQNKSAARVNLVDALRELEEYPVNHGRTDVWIDFVNAAETGAGAIEQGHWGQLDTVVDRMERYLEGMKQHSESSEI